MKNIVLDQLRSNILLHQDEIKAQMNHSPYFNDFLQIGFLDFFCLTYSNSVSFDHSDTIIGFLEQGEGWEHFFENFCFQSKISTDQLLTSFFLAMQTFQSFDHLKKIRIMHIVSMANQPLLHTIPYYFEYLCNYAINAEAWIELLDIIISDTAQSNAEDPYIAFAYFLDQIEFFPENIKLSILMTIGLRLEFPIYYPSKNYVDYTFFTDWIINEIEKKKAQKRAIEKKIEIV